jgi:DNA-binding IclR family transcriptional regulator
VAGLESFYADARDAAPPLPELLRKLETVRRKGYGLNLNESERGISAIGMCLRSPDGAAIAAISVSAPSTRLPRGSIPMTAQALRHVRLVERDLAGLK